MIMQTIIVNSSNDLPQMGESRRGSPWSWAQGWPRRGSRVLLALSLICM